MRTVFNNSMCAHVWAQLTQPHGRSGSMKFDGARAFSYWAHVATIQRLSESDQSQRVALFSSEFMNYSVSTRQHIGLYQRAASQYPQFTVPKIDFHADEYQQPAQHAANLEYLTKAYTAARDALMRVPCESYRVNDGRAYQTLRELEQQLVRYCNAFHLPAPVLDVTADVAAIEARRDRLANDPKRAAKREASKLARERAEQRAKEAAEQKRILRLQECSELIAVWRAGAADARLPYDCQTAADGSAMLRIRGDVVETSQGAEAPLSAVRYALEIYTQVMDANAAPWTPGTSPVQLGNFTLDRINVDGSVKAGCHRITAREIEQLRSALS